MITSLRYKYNFLCLGDEASFGCVFENADRVQWYFEDRTQPIESDDEKTVHDNGTLVIHKVEDKDRGVYSCHGVKGDTAQVYTTELLIACEYTCIYEMNLNIGKSEIGYRLIQIIEFHLIFIFILNR